MVVVLSVPHTGTRFTCSYLESIGVIFRQYHTIVHSIDDLRHEVLNKAIIPIRDPLLCLASTYIRSSLDDESVRLNKVLDEVVLGFDLLMQMEGWFNHTTLRLDCDDKNAELEKISKFCGKDINLDFEWKPVGNKSDKATDYELWEAITKDWDSGLKMSVRTRLQLAREHYGY